MKRVFQHPPAMPDPNGRTYWRSLGELHDTPEFRSWLEREFPAGAAEMEMDGVSRRNFLQLMGASLALAGFGLSGCRRPEAQLVPFAKSVEWLIPGKALLYATAMPRRGGAMPLIATTNDGRPTKLEGNPLHPASNGSTDTFAQCSILDLYDPDRSRRFLEDGKESDALRFADALKKAREAMLASGGADTAILVEEVHSPTRERLRAELAAQFPKLHWCVYDPLRPFNEVNAGKAAFGGGVRLAPRFEKADVILSLDSDFLHVDEGGIEASRDFAARRRIAKASDPMNRLYVVENRYTLTGGMADHRLRCPASQIGAVAVALAHKLGSATGSGPLGDLLSAIPGGDEAAARLTANGKQDQWLSECAKDLLSARGKSLVTAGPRQPVFVQLLVMAINGLLENIGQTLVALEHPEAVPQTISISEVKGLISDRQIKTLFILGGNPVYNALANLDWSEAQRSVENVIRLGYHEDETSAICKWHAPMAHFLESWGDARGTDGTYTAIQPMILPLFGGWSELDLLNALLGREKTDKPDLIRDTFKQVTKTAAALGSNEFESAWSTFLRTGFAADTAAPERSVSFNVGAAKAAIGQDQQDLHGLPLLPAPPTESAPEVVLFHDYKMDDGRYANNGWLQEMPDPITKLTWDNAAMMSPAMGKRLGLRTGDTVELDGGHGRKMKAPVWLAPGHADNSISIALGYGRQRSGKVGLRVGQDAYVLRTAWFTYVVPGAKVSRLAEPHYLFATTQEHQSMEGRNIVREMPLDVYRKNAGFDDEGRSFVAKYGIDAHLPPNIGMYEPAPLTGQHQWGMSIDLNTCTGCNACTVACQAENNIPVVGKSQVIKGRVMHWMRIDRYYSTIDEKDEDPQVLTQPMLCQHCENAPCETVCPVNATVHSEEGLNLMAYNRCIGTRYCSNNCPYKVRRFNFFNYNDRPIEGQESGPFKGVTKLYLGPLVPESEKGMKEISKLQKNPNVTVRIRGVMEKCTFCIQRIEEAKIGQLRVARDSANTRVPTDSFKTACQQVCPVEAIIFGNIADPESKVSKIKEQDRDYKVLESLNVRPRVSYQARVRNPNAAMPGAEYVGKTLLGHENDPGMENGHRTNEAPVPGNGL